MAGTTGVIVFVTADKQEDVDRITESLLNEKLAACVNVVHGVDSHYWWKGSIEHVHENLLIIKTVKTKVVRVIKKVKELHSYEVPEVIAVDIDKGNPDYLKWIQESVK
jgi:periplasmic divalent cation tolerance protein